MSQATNEETTAVKATDPTGRPKRFTDILDVFTKSFAAVAACTLLFSVVHDAGYFSSIGWQFMPLMSPSDYIRNTVLWLPLTACVLVAAVFTIGLMPVSKPRQTGGSPVAILILLVLAALLAVAEFSFDVTGLGLGYGIAFYVFWVAGLFPFTSRGQMQQWILVIGLGAPILLAVPFMIGKLSAVFDLDLSRTYSVALLEETNRVEKQAVLLRVLDRGFLLYVPSSRQVIFAKNEQVLSISGSPVSDENLSRACRWFGWNWACAWRPLQPVSRG